MGFLFLCLLLGVAHGELLALVGDTANQGKDFDLVRVSGSAIETKIITRYQNRGTLQGSMMAMDNEQELVYFVVHDVALEQQNVVMASFDGKLMAYWSTQPAMTLQSLATDDGQLLGIATNNTADSLGRKYVWLVQVLRQSLRTVLLVDYSGAAVRVGLPSFIPSMHQYLVPLLHGDGSWKLSYVSTELKGTKSVLSTTDLVLPEANMELLALHAMPQSYDDKKGLDLYALVWSNNRASLDFMVLSKDGTYQNTLSSFYLYTRVGATQMDRKHNRLCAVLFGFGGPVLGHFNLRDGGLQTQRLARELSAFTHFPAEAFDVVRGQYLNKMYTLPDFPDGLLLGKAKCEEQCAKIDSCAAYTVNTNNGACYLKSALSIGDAPDKDWLYAVKPASATPDAAAGLTSEKDNSLARNAIPAHIPVNAPSTVPPAASASASPATSQAPAVNSPAAARAAFDRVFAPKSTTPLLPRTAFSIEGLAKQAQKHQFAQKG